MNGVPGWELPAKARALFQIGESRVMSELPAVGPAQPDGPL
jgi:hypothetical protein